MTLFAAAAPPCHECEQPILRVEQSWTRRGDEWHPTRTAMVCAEGHRVPVEPFEDSRPPGG